MSYKFNECVKTQRLRTYPIDKISIERELTESHEDLVSSKKSLEQADYKWAIIKAYYSMFHGGKSLVLSSGYREKSHECLIIAVEKLFVDSGELPSSIVSDLWDAKSAREAADYGLTYGEDAARAAVKTAEDVYSLIYAYHLRPGYPSR